MQWNRGPQGPLKTTYFDCVEKGCKARLATVGDLDGDLTLKYHRSDQHTHSADASKNIVSASLHEFRDRVKSNPECSAKQIFEEISTNALEGVSSPNKLDLAAKLPTFRNGKSQATKINLKKIKMNCILLVRNLRPYI